MNQKLHPGPHPDADQLSIFVEGADTARERKQMLTHLAECQECRDVVFLMQPPVEIASAAKEVSSGWIWNRWLLPASLAGAALAGFALLLYVQPWKKGPEVAQENRAVVQPAIDRDQKAVAPSNNATPAVPPEKAKSGSGPDRAPTNSVREDAAHLKSSNVGSTASAPEAPQAHIPSVPAPAMAGAATAAQADAQSGVDSAVVENSPLNGRTVTSLQPLATPPSAPPATPRNGSEAQQNLPALRVESSIGQIETASGVSGHVSDASGAVIAGATVVLRDTSGSRRQTATSADGSFRLAGIPAGRYDLTVTAPGFTSNQQSLDLKPNELAMLEPVLAVGTVTQSVEVTASAPVLETDSMSLVSTAKLPSNMPVAASASLGKRILSLDDAGGLFLSRNAGKSWKKVAPQWTGKAVNIAITAAGASEAKNKSEAPGGASALSIFRLTTDSGAQWTSKDGTHWRPQ
jgi:hypothetical protein